MPIREAQIATEAEIRRLLQEEEGQYLEFKGLWDRRGPDPRTLKRDQVRDVIVEHLAAFANADGGRLFLGVDDETHEPTGHGYPEEAIAGFLQAPDSRLVPTISVRYQRVALDGKEVLLLEVDSGPQAVMMVGNGFPYRTGDQVIRLTQEEINARKRAYRAVGYEGLPRPEATLEDLDLDLVRGIFDRTAWKERPPEENLERHGLIRRNGRRHVLTNAALLLFSRPPLSRWHPRSGVRFFRVRGTGRRHGRDRNVEQLLRIEEPIPRLIEQAHAFARGQIRRSEKLHDLFFREVPEYPDFAWQEAIVNAVAHREYAEAGNEIEVWFYDDRLEVLSPGELVETLTIERLLERKSYHASRNPRIVRVLAEVGVMREEGEGIPRMFDEMEASFLGPPGLASSAERFTVTLSNHPIFEGGSPEWRALVDRLPISIAQKRILNASPDGFRSGDYQKLNAVGRDEAYRGIQGLVDAGIVVPPERKGRGAVYRVHADLIAERTWVESRLAGVRAHLAEHGFLTNQAYRQLVGVTRWKAAQELRRLCQRRYLVARGKKRGARYLPGPALRGTSRGKRE